jgi:hypothetical protein
METLNLPQAKLYWSILLRLPLVCWNMTSYRYLKLRTNLNFLNTWSDMTQVTNCRELDHWMMLWERSLSRCHIDFTLHCTFIYSSSVYYTFPKSPLFDSVLSHLNPVHLLTPIYFLCYSSKSCFLFRFFDGNIGMFNIPCVIHDSSISSSLILLNNELWNLLSCHVSLPHLPLTTLLFILLYWLTLQ